jgi:hypothetical protein
MPSMVTNGTGVPSQQRRDRPRVRRRLIGCRMGASAAALGAALAATACDRQLPLAPAPQAVPPEVEARIKAANHVGITAIAWEVDPRTGRESVVVRGFTRTDSSVGTAIVSPPADVTGGTLMSQAPATNDWPYSFLGYPPIPPAGGRATRWVNNTSTWTSGFTCTIGGVTTRIMGWQRDSIVNIARINPANRATGAFVPTGGHGAAHTSPKPVGSWSPRNGVADATGRVRSTFTSERAAGDEYVVEYWRITDPSDPCYQATIDGPGQRGREFWCRMGIRFRGLVRLAADSNLSIPTTWSSNHDDLFYVTPSVRTATRRAGMNYQRLTSALPSGPQAMTVNAASLKFGGINDVDNNWSHLPNGHNTHRTGEDVDVDGVNDTPAVHRRLALAAQRAGFERCDPHGPRGAPNHVHCYWTLYR